MAGAVAWPRLPGKRLDGAQKVAPVKKHHKVDRPASFATTFAAIENLILDVDRKAIVAAALRTGPATIDPAAQLNAAPGKLIFEPDRARIFDAVIMAVGRRLG